MSQTVPFKKPDAEWIEKRDASGHLLFLYSPKTDAIRIKAKGIETDISLPDLRREGIEILLGAANDGTRS